MFNTPLQFAETSGSSGIGAFNINLKGLIFQFVTFVIVLLVFKRWILPPLLKTLEDRRKILEQSLTDARQTQEALAQAEDKAEEIIAKARTHADETFAQARKSAEAHIVNAETAAAERAALIIKDAEAHLDQERQQLRSELRAELAELVADATEKIIHQKLDKQADRALIERSLKELG